MSHGIPADLLTRGEVRKISKRLKARGMRLPSPGWCGRLPEDFSHRELCSYGGGRYMLVGWRGRR